MKFSAFVGLLTVAAPVGQYLRDIYDYPARQEPEAPTPDFIGCGGDPVPDKSAESLTRCRFLGMDWSVAVPQSSERDLPPQY
jgi:hypothetical protein